MHPMRQLRSSPLLLLLLLWGCTCGCLATNAEWQPLRIHVSMEDLKDPKKYCTTAGTAMWTARRYQRLICRGVDVLTAEKNATLVNVILPEAVKLHTERLLVKRETEPIKVPATDKYNRVRCSAFEVPTSHTTEGVKDTDFVLYVAAKPGPTTLYYCNKNQDGRPLYAALNVDPSRLTGAQSEIRSVAHEIAHGLGFNVYTMEKRNVLKFKRDVRPRAHTITVLQSTTTLAKAREHFNCSTLDHVELHLSEMYEDHAHWSHRVAKDELMAPRTPHSVGRYSVLTMAAFEDLGFFKAVWEKAEPMGWGKNIGCEYFEKHCTMDLFQSRTDMFCEGEKLRCTSDRGAVGVCHPVASHHIVFRDGLHQVDQCPFVQIYYKWDSHSGSTSGVCSDLLSGHLQGSLVGNDSWCLDTESFKLEGNGDGDGGFSGRFREAEVGGVCARVSCVDKKVMVQYLGNSAWHECTEGESIPIVSTVINAGKIKCPKYEEVCLMHSKIHQEPSAV